MKSLSDYRDDLIVRRLVRGERLFIPSIKQKNLGLSTFMRRTHGLYLHTHQCSVDGVVGLEVWADETKPERRSYRFSAKDIT